MRTDGARQPVGLLDGELTPGREISRFRAVDADQDSPNVSSQGSSEIPSIIAAAFAAIGSRDAERSVEKAELRFIDFGLASSARMGVDFAPATTRECGRSPRVDGGVCFAIATPGRARSTAPSGSRVVELAIFGC